MTLIFDNNFISIYFNDLQSGDLVCTFSCMDFQNAHGCGWGRGPLNSLGYSSLEFVNKGNLWHPWSVIDAAAEAAILDIAGWHRKRVNYGFSMGGYGAVKHSKALSADYVLSMSPQWSINPADVWDYDQRLMQHYRQELHDNMRVTADDTAGRVYLFYDPYLQLDVWNVGKISEACERVEHIRMPWMGHETIDAFASKDTLGKLLEATLSDSPADIVSLAHSRRRAPDNSRRVLTVINSAVTRKPALGALVRERFRDRLRPDLVPLLLT